MDLFHVHTVLLIFKRAVDTYSFSTGGKHFLCDIRKHLGNVFDGCFIIPKNGFHFLVHPQNTTCYIRHTVRHQHFFQKFTFALVVDL